MRHVHGMIEATASSIEQFVRRTLGCQCPDEVFRSVAISRLPADAGQQAVVQLVVGARLLIHVVALPADPAASDWIERLAARGRVARDRAGYNRFRLAVVAPGSVPPPHHIAERFAGAIQGDDRAHLHVVSVDQLPGAVLPANAVA